MAWTTPRTWVTGELVTSTMMNTHVRDNLTALKAPPTASAVINQAADYSTSSTSFVATASEFTFQITTNGGDLMIGFQGTFKNSAGGRVYLDVEIDDGVDPAYRVANDDGIVAAIASSTTANVSLSFVWLKTSLAAGSYQVRLMWKTSTGTATLYSGAGTAGGDLHPQMWVREVS